MMDNGNNDLPTLLQLLITHLPAIYNSASAGVVRLVWMVAEGREPWRSILKNVLLVVVVVFVVYPASTAALDVYGFPREYSSFIAAGAGLFGVAYFRRLAALRMEGTTSLFEKIFEYVRKWWEKRNDKS